MNLPSLILGSPQWRTGAARLMAVASLLILWSYARADRGDRCGWRARS